ncbi:helix-turn-helix domain-containing protein [Glutamicibacter soli]|uniref:Helix-turn-helix domain-containing protein n=1 Tax=Glutamicibacter soli TaxID=453836 RepID=A0A6L9G9T1_9MICC|nr:helix-turn-helix domain-containing protein [Glutamicibacter soli]NAZ17899.1 helix-turn-helix domain-containing protein [Glutamicibacter soli]
MSNVRSELIVTAEVAERLGVTPRHVSRLVDEGKLAPVFKAPGIRGAYLFDRTEVEALAESGAK